MTVFQFIASLVGSLAWPVTVLALVIAFHRSILGLLEKLRRFKGWGIEASFSDAAVKLAGDTERAGLLGPPETESPKSGEPIGEAAANLLGRAGKPTFYGGGAALNPVEVIINGWGLIATSLRMTALANGEDFQSDGLLVSILSDAGKLKPETVALVDEARKAKDDVLLGRSGAPDMAAALLYMNTAHAISTAIMRDAGLFQP